jgi:4-phospho-D-threonate 3-dehydrogenase / 4-phospho-D-erythronate 3-dehydrogenase
LKNKPIIAITMGDPTGVGAEITVKTLAKPEYYEMARPLVLGDKDRIRQSLNFVSQKLDINIIGSLQEAKFTKGIIDVFHVDVPGAAELPYGKPCATGGEAAVSYVFKGIELALAREADAVCTGPLHKEAMHMAGYTQYAGHTEIFAERTNTKDYAMMLYTGNFYVIHVSTHCSLRNACERATRERVKKVIDLARELITIYQVPNPLIAVAGLNPHSGEGGVFGTEEIDSIIPAIEEARAQGIQITGPVPPDSLFVRAMKGQYQVMVVMYHDQGHIPVKIINFDEGVNVTLGIPIIRTSVDHGTAYGKAGKGTASPASMEAAFKLATYMAVKKYYSG